MKVCLDPQKHYLKGKLLIASTLHRPLITTSDSTTNFRNLNQLAQSETHSEALLAGIVCEFPVSGILGDRQPLAFRAVRAEPSCDGRQAT